MFRTLKPAAFVVWPLSSPNGLRRVRPLVRLFSILNAKPGRYLPTSVAPRPVAQTVIRQFSRLGQRGWTSFHVFKISHPGNYSLPLSIGSTRSMSNSLKKGGPVKMLLGAGLFVVGVYVVVAVLKTVFWLSLLAGAGVGGFWLWRRSGGNPGHMQREVQQAITKLSKNSKVPGMGGIGLGPLGALAGMIPSLSKMAAQMGALMAESNAAAKEIKAHALDRLKADNVVRDRLGVGLDGGAIVEMLDLQNNDKRVLQFRFPVKGPKQSGLVTVRASLQGESFTYESFVVDVGHERFDIEGSPELIEGEEVK